MMSRYQACPTLLDTTSDVYICGNVYANIHLFILMSYNAKYFWGMHFNKIV